LHQARIGTTLSQSNRTVSAVLTTTIYVARRIITMNPSQPEATHVAVRDGRILGVGRLADLAGWGAYQLNEQFQSKVILPGFVEGHAHAFEGSVWSNIYCGYFDRLDPDGTVWSGAKSIDAVKARLAEAHARSPDPAKPLTGWGLDPIYFGDRRVTRADLDQVASDRPIGVMHASFHILNVNTTALERAGLLRSGHNHPGIVLGADGLPTGELKGPEAMASVLPCVGLDRGVMAANETGLRQFARLGVRTGVTTATDLANMLSQDAVAMMLRVTTDVRFPMRIVPLRIFREIGVAALIDRATELSTMSTDKLRLGIIKIVADGSIQGFSARLNWPGYFNGAPNGLWYVTPEQMRELYSLALERGLQIHTHTNGNQATDLALDCMQDALALHPRADHRFTLQHAQMSDPAQFRRMATLGLCVNLFPNHHYYWGDQHSALTLGPERAERMNACASALAAGVPMAIHSDAPVTPLGPLFTAWCAVNRVTASGRTLGSHECISVADALRTITLGAAYTLKLDAEIGSITCGKRADFAILEDDPTTVPPSALKDVRVWGTLLGGHIFEAATI
jgi:predicted amidohydrolase YtcJ